MAGRTGIVWLCPRNLARCDAAMFAAELNRFGKRPMIVGLRCRPISRVRAGGAWLQPIDDVAECVESRSAAAGPGARLAVVPQGPQTIPYIAA